MTNKEKHITSFNLRFKTEFAEQLKKRLKEEGDKREWSVNKVMVNIFKKWLKANNG